MYGSSGMFLNASFPGHPTLTATRADLVKSGRLSPPALSVEEEDGVWVEGDDGRCRQVQVRCVVWLYIYAYILGSRVSYTYI